MPLAKVIEGRCCPCRKTSVFIRISILFQNLSQSMVELYSIDKRNYFVRSECEISKYKKTVKSSTESRSFGGALGPDEAPTTLLPLIKSLRITDVNIHGWQMPQLNCHQNPQLMFRKIGAHGALHCSGEREVLCNGKG